MTPPNPAECGSNRAQAREKFNRSYLCLRDCLGTMVTDTSMKVCGGKKIFKLPDLKKKKKGGGGISNGFGVNTQKHKIRPMESINITYFYTNVVKPQKYYSTKAFYFSPHKLCIF